MESLGLQLIQLLEYLTPGFIAAWIYYGLTPYSKPEQFERVIQAFIFSVITQGVVSLVEMLLLLIGSWHSLGVWTATSELLWSLFLAVILGLVVVYYVNNDCLHYFLRKYSLTKETSYPSDWYSVFHKNPTWVKLYLKGEKARILFGFPVEWPNNPDNGHFFIKDGIWISRVGEEEVHQDVHEQVAGILVDVKEVELVEFIKEEKTS